MLKLLLIVNIVLLSLSLTACQEIGKGGRMAEKHSIKAIKETKTALERVFTYYPETEEYKAIPYTFCYRVMQDINCYDQPIPEARARLVGWQGRDGSFIKKGSEMPPAEASVKQVSKKQPARTASPTIEKTSAAALPKKSAQKPLEPVFVSVPPIPKEDSSKTTISNVKSNTALY